MRRRQFIALLGSGAAVWPLVVRAQHAEQMRRVGVMVPYAESDHVFQGWVASFRDGLAKLGWIEGRNLRIDYRWAGGNGGKLLGLAAELVALMPDAIFAIGSPTVANVPHRADCVRERRGPGGRRFRQQLGTTDRQHHRICRF